MGTFQSQSAQNTALHYKQLALTTCVSIPSIMDNFCLRWQHYEASLITAFQEMKSDGELVDVTLACDEGQLQAHRVVLSACSSVFREILGQNKHPHPFIFLRGVNLAEMASILNFMYQGEVNVAQKRLNSFLSVAEELRVKGLAQYKHQSENNFLTLKQKIHTLPQDLQLFSPKRSRHSVEMQVQGLASSHIREDRENRATVLPMLPLKPDPETLSTDPVKVIIPQPPSWEPGLDNDDISEQEENKFAGWFVENKKKTIN